MDVVLNNMERPFANKRPLGPFAQRGDSVVIRSTYDATNIDELPFDELEDNIEDLLVQHFEVSDVDASRGLGDIVVRVEYTGNMFDDKQEDEMLHIIKQEISRLGASNVSTSSYKYVF